MRKILQDDYRTISGYMHHDEAEELQDLARDRFVLEIGCFQGRSTIAMAHTAREILTVDHFVGDDFVGEINTRAAALENLDNFELLKSGKVRLLLSDGFAAFRYLDLSLFDFIFYDADHTYEATKQFLELAEGCPEAGCPIAVHDYGHPDAARFAGVAQAVDEFVERKGFSFRLLHTLAILGELESKIYHRQWEVQDVD